MLAAPSAQGKGLGARLLAALIEASRRAGDRTM
ncbi:MAG: GNAT family N-acetyltransferase, partial [Tannerella forsythia]